MEELLELKALLLQGNIQGSLAIVEDLEEMGRKGIIKTIRSYAVILLLHLIKRQVEQRTTRSWDVSIRNAVREIQRENQRRKSRGYYLNLEELREVFEEAYLNALDAASLEVEEGRYDAEELETLVNKSQILAAAIDLVAPEKLG